jgi:hypothetical protein
MLVSIILLMILHHNELTNFFEHILIDVKFPTSSILAQGPTQLHVRWVLGLFIVRFVWATRISWIGHLERMEDSRMPKRMMMRENLHKEKKG